MKLHHPLAIILGFFPLSSGNSNGLNHDHHHHVRRHLAKPTGENPNKPPKKTDPPSPTDPPTPPTGDLPYPTCQMSDGTLLRLWTMDEVQANTTHCNTVFYDRVYWMDEFIPIHKGGSRAIERNCQKDGTWLFENLQCISMVPDHFEGMLNMCAGYEEGVLAGSVEDPCATTGSTGIADPSWTKPVYEDPIFTDCDVYYNITCTALQDEQLLPLPIETINALSGISGSMAITNRRWTIQDVQAAQSVWTTPTIDTNFTEHCYTMLHGWVYDLAVSPLDGSDPFYLKHGNGMFPWEILRHCGAEMTPAFDAIQDMGKQCAPDHTLGALNVLTGYLVGVELDGINDACSDANLGVYPPDACTVHSDDATLVDYTLAEFEQLPETETECYMILQGGVYNLAEFAKYHAGGASKITTNCGKDGTRTFLSKSFHKSRIFLGTLQDFKTGVIVDSVGDPCSVHYDEQLSWW